MKTHLKISLITVMLFFCVNSSKAQARIPFDKKAILTNSFRLPVEDSLLHEFLNGIYYSFYNPSYMSNKTPVFTMLKVDIDWDGKITGMAFSDSADPAFVKTYFSKTKEQDTKATLEKYAKIKLYKDLSLLIPVSFEPDATNLNKQFCYNYAESLLKFNKADFYRQISYIISSCYFST